MEGHGFCCNAASRYWSSHKIASGYLPWRIAWQIGNNHEDRVCVTMRDFARRVNGCRIGSRLAESLVTRLRVTTDRFPSPVDLPKEMARAASVVEQALDVLLPPVEGAEG